MPIAGVIERRIFGVQIEAGLPAFEQRFELTGLFAGHGFLSHALKSSAACVARARRSVRICARQHSCARTRLPANKKPVGRVADDDSFAAHTGCIDPGLPCLSCRHARSTSPWSRMAGRKKFFSAESIEKELANVAAPGTQIVLPARNAMPETGHSPEQKRRSIAHLPTATSMWCWRSAS